MYLSIKVLTQKLGCTEAELARYRISSVVPLMPDFYVGDPAALDQYLTAARKLQGAASFVGSFMKSKKGA